MGLRGEMLGLRGEMLNVQVMSPCPATEKTGLAFCRHDILSL